MSISPLSANCNASYPKYLENKKRTASYLMLASGTLGVSTAALHFSKAKIAQKNPWLLGAGAALSLLGSVIGVSKLSSASNEIKKISSQTEQQDIVKQSNSDVVEINNDQNKEDRSKQAINHMIKSNPMLNPTGYIAHAANPALETSPLDNPFVNSLSV